MWLVFCYTIQLVTIKIYIKFQNYDSSSCWEIFDKKKFTDRQTNKQTKTITEKAKTTQVVAGKSLTEKSLQTDKQTNKQTDKNNYRKAKTLLFYVVC